MRTLSNVCGFHYIQSEIIKSSIFLERVKGITTYNLAIDIVKYKDCCFNKDIEDNTYFLRIYTYNEND